MVNQADGKGRRAISARIARLSEKSGRLGMAAKKAAKRRGRLKKGSAAAKAYMASIRPNAGSPAPKKRAAGTAKRRRRRGYQRNPPMLKRLTDGAMGALYVTGGKAGARIVADLVAARVPTLVVGGIDVARVGVQAGTAVVLGLVADRVLPARAAEQVVIGALTAPIEGVIRGLNIPYVSAALSSYPMPIAPRRLSMVPVPSPRSVRSYPRPMLNGYVPPPRSVAAMTTRAMGRYGAGAYDLGYN